ncbi:RNA polymerase sigma-70 factor (ECF subfamily) [Arcicella sp. BE140]|nr:MULTISPECIES: sigma-70 family RNA polymerase sigma factor [unclassified Arcicella]MDR6561236.1 RNA polymerase sigma-70 factor (ECF subfamily) [Arcicella sp. BE51]MDR6811120.1 RNA polymerase sigma-70 factor (ECF subfamily) [Arcicella sp. BE140]MDR6822470.1 RNA polymerase sigma-70 factor (ECF subfamily) [Arcicella sp. BE139]
MKLITLFQTEEALVKACQKGDPKAQRRVYEKYSPKMLGICFRYVHDEFEAEEIMIEGFVKVFDKINSFKLEGSFEGWIRRIMVNESLMYMRSNKKAQFEVSYDQILYEPEPEQFRTDLETKDLLKLIEKLPTGYKTVFNLYAIEGYSHAEIAEQLGITESTSKSQLSRARVILQNAVVQTI